MAHRSDRNVLEAFRDRLGRVPDREIAEQARVSRTLVVNYRKKLGIAPYQGHRPSAPGAETRTFRGRPSALDPYATLLGKLPDAEIARRAGVTAENVRTYRRRRGISATWQGGEPSESRTVEPDPRPEGGEVAFLVLVDTPKGEQSYAIVAHDIREAASQAMQRLPTLHPEAVIRSIQRVAGLLGTP